MVRPPYGRCPALAALALSASLWCHAALGNDLVLLDFWSPTCGPCMQMKPTVESLINARYPIRQIDVSRDPEMARQHDVTGIPCFVMLVDGQEVDRVVGATSSERLQQMFKTAGDIVRSQRNPGFRGQSLDNAPAAGVADVPARVHPADEPARSYPVADGPAPRPPAAIDGPTEDAAWNDQFDGKLLSSSVRILVDDAKGRSHGTGTIIDAREGEALVITCGHIFRESKGEGPVTVEISESGPQGVRVVEKLTGEVIPGSIDLDRDLALLSIRPTRPVCVAPIAPGQTVIERGNRGASVGCSNGQDPTVMPTRVTWLNRYQGPPNIETSGAPVEGRSGGGLFNEQGQLIGVCFAADYEGNKGLYAGLDSIHGELDRLGLKEIYGSANTQTLAGGPTKGQEPRPPVVRGQEPAATPADEVATTATPATVAVAPPAADAAPPQNLNTTELAAWEEIMSRAATHEVVCIIRPKEPGGQSEVITLDNVSTEFVDALAARQRRPQTEKTQISLHSSTPAQVDAYRLPVATDVDYMVGEVNHASFGSTMIWYVAIIAVVNLGLGYALAMLMGAGRGRAAMAGNAADSVAADFEG